MKKELLRFLSIMAIIVVAYFFLNFFSVVSEQEKKFTEQCHSEHGVVIEEHATDNLLCFPTDA